MLKKIIIPIILITQLTFGSCPQQGPNRFQNAPVLSSAVNNDGVITVSGASFNISSVAPPISFNFLVIQQIVIQLLKVLISWAKLR